MFDLNDNWLKQTKDGKVKFMINHKWAFMAWEIARKERIIDENSFLLHVDAHLDDVPELVTNNTFVNHIRNRDIYDLIRLFDYNLKLSQDNFIWPSILRETFKDIVYVSSDSQEELTPQFIMEFYKENDITLDESLKSHLKKISLSRYSTVKELIEKDWENKLCNKKVLDIDLDFFNESDNLLNPKMKNIKEIQSILRKLKKWCEWDLITVALSPRYCGGIDECEYIFNIFLEEFNINLNDLIDWNLEVMIRKEE